MPSHAAPDADRVDDAGAVVRAVASGVLGRADAAGPRAAPVGAEPADAESAVGPAPQAVASSATHSTATCAMGAVDDGRCPRPTVVVRVDGNRSTLRAFDRTWNDRSLAGPPTTVPGSGGRSSAERALRRSAT